MGNTAFLRYSRIFQRKNSEEVLDIPVAVITDCDVRPDNYYASKNEKIPAGDYSERAKKAVTKKEVKYKGKPVEAFISKDWTLEYAIALSKLKADFYKAILIGAEIKKDDDSLLTEKLELTVEKRQQVDEKIRNDFEIWARKGMSNEEIAFEIYNNTQLKGQISKAIVAQCFAEILDGYPDQKGLQDKLIKDPNFKYIIDAIIYATSGKLEKEASDD